MNVYELAKERIEFVFNKFEYVCVSFSGGKDSGILLNLAIDHCRKNYPGRRMGVFHIDYEAQYQMTTDYVDSELKKNSDILDIYRICLPVAAHCATSMHQSYWIPWDSDKKELWVRDIPESINESNHSFDFFVKGMWDYDFQSKFPLWLKEKLGVNSVCCLVGIRTQESFNRWRAIHSAKNNRKFQEKEWTLDYGNGIVNAYPIFDWITEDVWICNAQNGYDYNKLYDIFWQAGLTIGQMRVASPFHDCGIENLKLYKVIDPKNWGKMIGRTNGVNFSGLYGGTTAMGWRSIKLPDGHTWKTYYEFLLTTLPESAAESYSKKLEKSICFWKEKGGVLSQEVINKLLTLGINVNIGDLTNYKTNKHPVKMEYLDDIDITEFTDIPTYKRMCICIMKNDHLCKFMGFSATKTETQIRTEAESKYSKVLESK